jgi:hypothetical protein
VSPFPEWDSGFVNYDSMKIWKGNARIKELELTQIPSGKSLEIIKLKDNVELQGISLALNPGTYRFTIRSVYPGDIWHDVGLGEVHFFPWDKSWLDDVEKDSFFDTALKSLPYTILLWDRPMVYPLDDHQYDYLTTYFFLAYFHSMFIKDDDSLWGFGWNGTDNAT